MFQTTNQIMLILESHVWRCTGAIDSQRRWHVGKRLRQGRDSTLGTPPTFEIGQAFPIAVGTIEDSCTILRSRGSADWQVIGLFSEDSGSQSVALTRLWQRLGY